MDDSGFIKAVGPKYGTFAHAFDEIAHQNDNYLTRMFEDMAHA